MRRAAFIGRQAAPAPNLLPVEDLGPPIAYTVLEEGTPVFDRDAKRSARSRRPRRHAARHLRGRDRPYPSPARPPPVRRHESDRRAPRSAGSCWPWRETSFTSLRMRRSASGARSRRAPENPLEARLRRAWERLTRRRASLTELFFRSGPGDTFREGEWARRPSSRLRSPLWRPLPASASAASGLERQSIASSARLITTVAEGRRDRPITPSDQEWRQPYAHAHAPIGPSGHRFERTLTGSSSHVESPAWSPDGERLAFVEFNFDQGEVYTINPDGTGRQQVTDNSVPEHSVEWSPDGSKLVVSGAERTCQDPPGPCPLQRGRMSPDGSTRCGSARTRAAPSIRTGSPIIGAPPPARYVRPKTASLTSVSLVPAVDACHCAEPDTRSAACVPVMQPASRKLAVSHDRDP